MDRDRRLSIVVGLFVLGGLALFAVAVLSLTAQRGPFTQRFTLVARFQNVQGLIDGAPVRLAGKDVGVVESVRFSKPGPGQLPVRVQMRVDASVQDRVRGDSRATIGTIGLLGDKYIELSMGSAEQPVLADGAEIATATPLDPSDVMQKGTQALDGIATLAANLNRVAEQFAEARGAAKIAETAQAASDIVTQVKTGKGLLHDVIYGETGGGDFASVGRSLATLEGILKEIAHGDGLAHQLIYEPADAQPVLARTAAAAKRLESILAKIDRGEGTLGMLIADPALYQDLRTLVGGANRSLVVRSLIRLSTQGEAADGEAQGP